MSFTITKNIERLPSYPKLCQLAVENQVHVKGDERTGSFSGRGVAGSYEFGAENLHGTFAGHGVKGEFRFEIGQATVTITDKPFWLPETLVKQKITEGLDTLATGLV